MSERFLSEEDLDLSHLGWDELLAWWDLWLRLAQASNEFDEHVYSHGVFRIEPGWQMTPSGVRRSPESSGSSGAPEQPQ